MKPFRKVNNPQLVNSVNKKHLKVEVEFKVGSNSFKVCRGHAPRTFEVYQNGELLNQDAHTKDYQKVLEQNILKMNYKSFTQIVVLGSSTFVPFMKLSVPQRREIIEDILDIQVFSTMNLLLRDRVKENNVEIQEVNYQIDLLKDKIELQKQHMLTLERRTEEDIKKKQKQIEAVSYTHLTLPTIYSV